MGCRLKSEIKLDMPFIALDVVYKFQTIDKGELAIEQKPNAGQKYLCMYVKMYGHG